MSSFSNIYYILTCGQEYLCFVACTAVCLGWFVIKTYAYIEYPFFGTLLYILTLYRYMFKGLHMTYVSELLRAQFTLTLLVPGLLTVGRFDSPGVTGLVLFLHGASLAVLESILYSPDSGL